VLDFGCGARPYERWFADAGSHYRGADIDGAHEVAISPTQLASADGEYDLVASFQVLEHVWDVGSYLGEARRVLRQDAGCCSRRTAAGSITRIRTTTAAGPRGPAARSRIARFPPGAHGARVGPLAWTTVFRSLGVAPLPQAAAAGGAALAAMVATALNAWRGSRTASRRVRSRRSMPVLT